MCGLVGGFQIIRCVTSFFNKGLKRPVSTGGYAHVVSRFENWELR